MPTSIQRKYYVTTFDELSTVPLVEGNVISLSDTDGLYYDVGNPAGSGQSVVRRKASAIEYVENLANARHERDTIFVVTEGNATTGYCWNEDNSEFYPVFNNAEVSDSQVQSVKQSPWNTKAYLVASAQQDTWTGTLLKTPDIYITTTGKIHADIDGSATTATSANSATTATSATSAMKDSSNHTITDYYLHDVSSNASSDLGSALTFTLGNGNTKVVRVSDHVYSQFTSLQAGIVPAASGGTLADLVLTGSGWVDKANISIGTATSADSATNDSAGNQIDATYYADVDYTTGVGLTLTSADGNTSKTVQLPISDYSVFTPSADGLVPKPSGAGETAKFLKGDGTWDSVPVNDYQGATAIAAGEAGLVPAAAAGEMNYFLRGDGDWGEIFSTTEAGLVPSPLVADASYSLRADGTWAASANTDTKDTAGSSQVQYGIQNTEAFTGDGTTTAFTLEYSVAEIISITIDTVETTAYTYDSTSNQIIFNTAPADEANIIVEYNSPEVEILYLIGAKTQNGGSTSPITYSNNRVYVLNNMLYANDNQLIDTTSYQNMTNKTFDGKSLGTSAFVETSSTVEQTIVTITDEFTGDGVTTTFVINYSPIEELLEVTLDGVVQVENVDYTFDSTNYTITFTSAPVVPYYNLLTTEPDDWEDNYSDYFTKVDDEYVAVEGAAQYTSNNNPNWDEVMDNIWKYDGGTYTELDYKPADWDTNYTDYFTRTLIAPTFALDTYYEYIASKIGITYKVQDPFYNTENVPTNSAVMSYTNTRINPIQSNLASKLSNSCVASNYNENVSDTFTGDGSTTEFTLTKVASGITSVKVAGAETSDYTFDDTTNKITFTSAPAVDDEIVVTYTLAYSIGDYVIYYDGDTTQLYRCNTAITAQEAFDPTHWDSIRVTELVKYHDIYSSGEKVVGTWADGTTLYEQTLTLSSLSASSSQTVAHGISANIIFIKEGFTSYTSSNVAYSGMISAYDSTAGDEELCIKIDGTNITYLAGTALANATAYITVRYTKPTI